MHWPIASALVVAAHPDDEVLGCGGLISRLGKEGTNVNVVFLSDGVSARYEGADRGKWAIELETRRNSGLEAARLLGANDPIYYDFLDNQLDQVPLLALTKIVERHLDEFTPNLVLTHFPGDLNLDHRRVAEAVITSTRPGIRKFPHEVWAFEVPSSTEWGAHLHTGFSPDIFVEVSAQVKSKLEALNAYNFEMRDFPHPRSERAIRALLDWRGSNAGLLQAEAFVQLSRVIR